MRLREKAVALGAVSPLLEVSIEQGPGNIFRLAKSEDFLVALDILSEVGIGRTPISNLQSHLPQIFIPASSVQMTREQSENLRKFAQQLREEVGLALALLKGLDGESAKTKLEEQNGKTKLEEELVSIKLPQLDDLKDLASTIKKFIQSLEQFNRLPDHETKATLIGFDRGSLWLEIVANLKTVKLLMDIAKGFFDFLKQRRELKANRESIKQIPNPEDLLAQIDKKIAGFKNEFIEHTFHNWLEEARKATSNEVEEGIKKALMELWTLQEQGLRIEQGQIDSKNYLVRREQTQQLEADTSKYLERGAQQESGESRAEEVDN